MITAYVVGLLRLVIWFVCMLCCCELLCLAVMLCYFVGLGIGVSCVNSVGIICVCMLCYVFVLVLLVLSFICYGFV